MVSKALVVGAYQTKLEALARLPEVELSVIVPPCWKGPEGTAHLEREHLSGYRLIVSPIRLNGQFHLHYYPELGRWMDRLQPNIVHMDEEPYNLATFLGLRAAKKRGVHTLFFSWQNLHRKYPWPFRRLEQWSFHLADYALAGNEDASDVLKRKGYSGPITVIPQFGIAPESFPPIERPTRHENDVLRVGYAGRLVPEKGIDLLLEAMAGLAIPWRATIVGSGSQEQQLREQARRLHIAEAVDFRGRIPSAQMPDFFRHIDVFVLPSRSRPHWVEQFGRVLIEAMASEVVVVGSDSGEIPRVIQESGLVFPEGDTIALRAALQRLAQDSALHTRLARAGRERVLTTFTQEHIARQTYDVYISLMKTAFGQSRSMV
jgi:glycosyltransferase involved in cell wall biosynthesis